MRLGIDFGTTRTIIAAADRGNFPVISFQTSSGDMQTWHPSLIGVRGDDLAFALNAQANQGEAGWSFLRSLKRLLGESSPDAPVSIGDRSFAVFELLVQYLTCLRQDLIEHSNLEVNSKSVLEAMIAIPANANSNQRFLTLEAFRLAGFRVLGMMNEPSAAGIEYAHNHIKNEWLPKKEYLVVYDLGGGTFDASVIGLSDAYHEVLTDEGIAALGGDDIDELLLQLALSQAGIASEISAAGRFFLLEECRRQKEGLHPNTRKIAIDLSRGIEGGATVMVTTEQLYAACSPLIENTVAAMEAAMARARLQSAISWNDVETIYLVGGSSDLPVVGRMLRERYGRRVRRSPYPYSATAIGLAIAADAKISPVVKERFTRHFGVWREAESGKRIVFDPIFRKDTLLPGRTEVPLIQTRSYRPAHNMAHFRYLECSCLTGDEQPAGDITPWQEVLFPVDPTLRDGSQLEPTGICRTEVFASQTIEERYTCNSQGMIEVTIADQTTGYEQKYGLRPLKVGAKNRKKGF